VKNAELFAFAGSNMLDLFHRSLEIDSAYAKTVAAKKPKTQLALVLPVGSSPNLPTRALSPQNA
jgi:hypothetical protein